MVISNGKCCEVCSMPFPTHLLNPLVGDVIEASRVCPVCALAFIRKTHDKPDFMYTNETNKLNYKEALEVVKNDTKGTQDNSNTSSPSG